MPAYELSRSGDNSITRFLDRLQVHRDSSTGGLTSGKRGIRYPVGLFEAAINRYLVHTGDGMFTPLQDFLETREEMALGATRIFQLGTRAAFRSITRSPTC
ncbi:hypothetical protein GF325_08515 [Candidatus Bathyarchaeota archaeon]|nr:hypothetical protein [Candidatus Bathyarchaeota archaeon]